MSNKEVEYASLSKEINSYTDEDEYECIRKLMVMVIAYLYGVRSIGIWFLNLTRNRIWSYVINHCCGGSLRT